MYLTSDKNSPDATLVNCDQISAIKVSTLRGAVVGSGQVSVAIFAGDIRINLLAPAGNTAETVMFALGSLHRSRSGNPFMVVDQEDLTRALIK